MIFSYRYRCIVDILHGLQLIEDIAIAEGQFSDHEYNQVDDYGCHDDADTDDDVDAANIDQHVVEFGQTLSVVVYTIVYVRNFIPSMHLKLQTCVQLLRSAIENILG